MPSVSVKIAWRNIWRHPLRSLLTVLAIAFATGVLIFFVSLQLSSYATSINASVSMFQGHLQIQREGMLENQKIRLTIDDTATVEEILEESADVVAYSQRAIAFALVSSIERSYGIQIFGVEPSTEPNVSTLPGVIMAGSYFSSENAEEAVLGELLAQNLQVMPGDELTLLGQGWDGSLASAVVRVAGRISHRVK